MLPNKCNLVGATKPLQYLTRVTPLQVVFCGTLAADHVAVAANYIFEIKCAKITVGITSS